MKVLFLLPSLCFATLLLAQDFTVSGAVKDDITKEPLYGVSVVAENGSGIFTDENGQYSLKLSSGEHTLSFSSVGYEKQSITFTLNGNTIKDILLKQEVFDLGIAVVSAGKFEQDLSEVTVSMDVVQPSLIENKNTTNMEDLIQQSPGVSIVDGEPQIRSGSGYSFGAGSRVMILVDDLPMLSGDAGRPSWGFLPIENVEQIEVIKGASSVLYGSAALSGVINIRTSYPKAEPLTKVNLFGGAYSDPQTSQGKYWSGQPNITGANFLHSRKFGNLDFVISGNVLGDDSYLGPIIDSTGTPASSGYNPFDVNRYDADSRARVSLSLRQHSKKITGLQYGINGGYLKGESLAALLWDNDTTGLYGAFEGSATRTKQTLSTLDPFIEYHDGNGGSHHLRTRWQSLDNDNDNNQGNFSDVLYGEYQFQQHFDSARIKDLTLTTGITGTYTESISQLFAGNEGGPNALNEATNVAAYLQLDKKFFELLNVSLGMRYEQFSVNGETQNKPVFRSGLSYQAAEATYLRASFGQGFRFPTIAEKFINTAVGLLNIYPNEELEAEESWSAEIGVKQGFKIKNFKGFVDVAGFWQEYNNFIEFTFGQWGPPGSALGGLGFRSLNTGSSRVTGLELTLMGTGEIGKTQFNLYSGYTFTQPISLNPDLVYADGGVIGGQLESSYNSTSSDNANNILKYRLQHLVRVDLEAITGPVTVGTSFRYNSRMQNIDNAFLLLEEQGFLDWGLRNWREVNDSGDGVLDFRIGYTHKDTHRIMLVMSNVLNREYAIRPLAIEAPRLTTLQYTLTIR
ncbi:MAG: TonB-dependent receptor [Bacteroidota bacterium]